MIKFISQIKSIFEEFDRKGISYAVIRNYEFILQDKIYEGKDTDVVILSKDTKKIRETMQANGFGRVPMNPFSMHEGYAKYIPEDKKLLQFHFHINGVTGRHARYLDAKDLLKRRVKRGFFYSTSSEDEFLAILLHNLLDLDKFKEKYITDLENLKKRNLNYDYIESKLQKVMSKRNAKEVLHLISSKNYARIEKIMPSLKRGFEFRNSLKIALVFVGGAVWKIPYIFKSAPLVSLIGMDGTGKTTTTEVLRELFEKNKIKYSMLYTGRGRNNILPIQFFGKIYRKAESSKKSSKISSENSKREANSRKSDSNAENQKQSSFIKKAIYTLAAPVFAFDLLLRYWFKIWSARMKKQIVVTDRYCTDILLMANVPMFFKKMLYSLFPKPSLTIYLWNKPEVLHSRKTAHPLDDLKRQEKIFADINKKVKPLAIKSEGIEKTTKQVAEAVFSEIFE